MKRPLMIIGFSLFVSLAVFSYLRTAALVSIAITLLVISLSLILLVKKLKPLRSFLLICVSCLVASLLILCSDFLYLRPAQQFDSATIEAEGYVKRIDNSSIILKCRIDDKYQNVYLKRNSEGYVRYGDKYKITATLIHINSLDSEYMRAKCRAQSCTFYTEDYEAEYTNDVIVQHPFEEAFLKLKNHLLLVQKETFSENTYGFINAITLGDKQNLSADIAVSFKRAGLSHVLAISGMHLSIISGVVFTFLRKFGKRKAAFITIFVTLFYMTLTGFAPSITRAGIMNIVMYVAVVFREDYDGITSISIACLVMCLLNPYCAADISLQLSVASTTGIMLVLAPTRRYIWELLGESTRLKRFIMWFSDILIISFAANLALMPFYVFVFGNVSLVAPVSNIVSSILTPVIISSSLIATLIAMLPVISGAACVPAFIADISTFGLIKSTKWFSDFKYASVGTEYTFMVIWVVASCVLFGYAAFTQKGKIKFHALILSMVVLFASIFCYNINNSSKIAVTVLPTYTHGCVVITENNHTTAIYRTSSEERLSVVEYALNDAGVFDIDTLIIPEYDNSSDVIRMIDDYNVETLIINNEKADSALVRKLKELNVDVLSIYPNREFDIGDRVTVKFDVNKLVKGILVDVDGVIFFLSYEPTDMLEKFDFYKETDVALIGKHVPYGLSYTNLSYIAFTNIETEKDMYRETAHLADRYAFTDNKITFMVEDASFYVAEEWGIE